MIRQSYGLVLFQLLSVLPVQAMQQQSPYQAMINDIIDSPLHAANYSMGELFKASHWLKKGTVYTNPELPSHRDMLILAIATFPHQGMDWVSIRQDPFEWLSHNIQAIEETFYQSSAACVNVPLRLVDLWVGYSLLCLLSPWDFEFVNNSSKG